MFKKSGDKNRNLPVLSNTDRHEVAFKVCSEVWHKSKFDYFKALDSNNDGYVSKAEFSKLMKNLSMDQVLYYLISTFWNSNKYSFMLHAEQSERQKLNLYPLCCRLILLLASLTMTMMVFLI